MKIVKKIFLYGILLSLIVSLMGVISIISFYYYVKPDLPSLDPLIHAKFSTPLKVFTKNGELIAEFGKKRREPITFDETPKQLINAFLAAEDDKFFTHDGVDYKGLARAVWHLASTGTRKSGGSTITMQLARNFLLTNEKTYTRKFKEIALSYKIEEELDKKKIMELYLNRIFLGNRAYGIGAAAQVYYGKTPSELTIAQVAMIAGLPKAPSTRNPIAAPKSAKARRGYVLGRMKKLGFITEEEYRVASESPITAKIHGQDIEVYAPYIAEMARQEAQEILGDNAFTEGYQIYTTIEPDLQAKARESLRNGLRAYDMRHGFRGVEAKYPQVNSFTAEEIEQKLAELPVIGGLKPAIVIGLDNNKATILLGDTTAELFLEDSKWARKYISDNKRGKKIKSMSDILEIGDVVRVFTKTESVIDKNGNNLGEKTKYLLSQVPAVSGAFVAISPHDGAVKSLVGGFDFDFNKFNMAYQAKRQGGSCFKPFIYSAALGKGYSTASMINDAPITFKDTSIGKTWRPENYTKKFYGPTSLRTALKYSRNLVSIRLLRQIGIDYAIDFLGDFGFDKSLLPNGLSLSLGSASVSPLEMARAYATIANGGYKIEPYFIEKVTTSSGEVLYQAEPKIAATPKKDDPNPEKFAPHTIPEQNIYLLTGMLKDVIRGGSGAKAYRALKRNDIAGKTGTTNDQKDTWFSGFNGDLAAVAWVGFAIPRSLGRGEAGGKTAIPIWIDFMKYALNGKPEKSMKRPKGLVTVKINPKNGLQTNAGNPNGVYETFREKNVPKMDPEAEPISVYNSDPSAPAKDDKKDDIY